MGLGAGLAASACVGWRDVPRVAAVQGPSLAHEALVTRLAFGSCFDQNKPAPIWDAIAERRPEIFLMIGDNVYADAEEVGVLARAYEGLRDSDGYRRMREATPVLATWDDHDYGRNDAGAEYPLKDASKQIMLDFFGEPDDSPRRQRPGVHAAYLVGPPGRRIQIIMLDTRYFRSEVFPLGRRGSYRPNDEPDATILGAAQWRWLEAQLEIPAELRIVASSIQVLSDEHPYERWGNFPRERARLLDTLGRAAGTIVVSGDRHRGELSRAGAGGGLHDLTSSSLNRPLQGHDDNELRVGEEVVVSNFGMVEIDWDRRIAGLSLVDEVGRARVRHEVSWDDDGIL